MKKILGLILILVMVNNISYAALTNNVVPVTKNGSSNPPTVQNSDITDTVGTGVSSGVPVTATSFISNGSGGGTFQAYNPSKTFYVNWTVNPGLTASYQESQPTVGPSVVSVQTFDINGYGNWAALSSIGGGVSNWANLGGIGVNGPSGINWQQFPNSFSAGKGINWNDLINFPNTTGANWPNIWTANQLVANGSGSDLFGNIITNQGVAVTNSGSTLTLTAANLIKQAVFQETGSTAATFTFDTGTNISSAITGIGGVVAGYGFSFTISNTSTQTITMASATGATLANTAVVNPNTSSVFYAINTGSNAWMIVGGQTPLGSGAEQTISYQPGLLTAVNASIGVYGKFVKASTVDNIVGSATTFSCVGNPTITMYECGTSTTCSSTPTTIGTVTITSNATAFPGTVSNPAITAGDYVGFATTAGTCASSDLSATAQIHSN